MILLLETHLLQVLGQITSPYCFNLLSLKDNTLSLVKAIVYSREVVVLKSVNKWLLSEDDLVTMLLVLDVSTD